MTNPNIEKLIKQLENKQLPIKKRSELEEELLTLLTSQKELNFQEQLIKNTLELEKKAHECKAHYQPEQRAYIYIGLIVLLLLLIYWLTKPDIDLEAKREARMEERLIKKMEMLKKLKE